MTAADTVVLIVEDDPQMRRLLRTTLAARGFRLLEAETAAQATLVVGSHNPDVVLLDLGLPDGDGIALTRRLREMSRAPIVVVSARGREDDKVEALDAGADDYLTKPFGVNELLARLRVALRHARQAAAPATTDVLEIDDLRIDFERREVLRARERIHLTPIEWRLLVCLARHPGRVLTHRQILQSVWGEAYVEHTHYVRVHMAELRKKIESDPARPRWLVTEVGVGYRLRDDV